MIDYSPFFSAHQHLRPVIEAVLEGRQGRLVTLADRPRAVRLDLGCYAVPGGDPDSEEAAVLVRQVPFDQEIVLADERWRRLVARVRPNDTVDAPMQAFIPGPDCRATAARLAATLPAGYRLATLDEERARQIDDELNPNALRVFGTPERLVADGLGLVALAGERLVCLATSYALSRTKVEVSIATLADHRGRGLAAAVAAAMLETCFRRGLEPHWHASNPISQRLAIRLGFQSAGTCDIVVPRVPSGADDLAR